MLIKLTFKHIVRLIEDQNFKNNQAADTIAKWRSHNITLSLFIRYLVTPSFPFYHTWQCFRVAHCNSHSTTNASADGKHTLHETCTDWIAVVGIVLYRKKEGKFVGCNIAYKNV